MPVVPYVDSAKRNWQRDDLELHAVDFDNASLAIAMVGNKNRCLGRNQLVGFGVCGERGTIIINGNQGAVGGEAVYACTDEDIAEHLARTGVFFFERTYTAEGNLSAIGVHLPDSLGGTLAWGTPTSTGTSAR